MEVGAVELESVTRGLCLYLEDYLPLANAHIADFIIDQFWERFVPDDIGKELLQLCDTDLAKLPSGCIYKAKEHEINQTKTVSEKDEPWVVEPKRSRETWDKDRFPRWKHDNLKDFILDAHRNRLPSLQVLSDLDVLLKKWDIETKEKVVIQQFMTAKKSHEVDIMADVCASIAAHKRVQTVIDIGSGRGYLSSHVHLMYGLSVLAVDSSQVNTNSAETRGKRLQKYWAGIVRNAKTCQTSKEDNICGPGEDNKNGAKNQDLSKPNPSLDLVKNGSTYEANSSQNPDTEATDNTTQVNAENDNSKKFVSITQFVTPETDLQELLRSHLSLLPQCEAGSGEEILGAGGGEEDVEAVGSREEVVGEGAPLLLTGLHTCGNLAPAMLDIFLHGRGNITALCNVGCCYHHLDEEFVSSPYQGHDALEPDVYGFPLSDLLRSRCFQLGRNARMLASQTPSRMAESGKLSHESLYFRALLQVILRDLTGGVQQDWQVGKIYAKSKDFYDYVKRALKKLNIADGDKVSRVMLDDYLSRFSHYERKLSAFVQLRAALAPAIESLILLDRLLYLKQQEEVAEAHLVQLFNDVTSPRCYGIIATRT